MGPDAVSGSRFDYSADGALQRVRPTLPQDPPRWVTGQDSDAYRQAAQRWASYIKRTSPIKDSLRLIEATLFDHLVAQLDQPSQQLVEAEIARGTFETAGDPYEKASMLVDLLTREPAQKTLQRYLDAFDSTTRTLRSSCSSMGDYVARFTGEASKFLRLMGAVPGDAIEHLLSLTMLNNAQLSPSVLQSAKLSLQRRAVESLDRKSISERYQEVSSTRIEALLRLYVEMHQMISSSAHEGGVNMQVLTDLLQKVSDEIHHFEADLQGIT
jgi:hypothetical protein